MECEYYIELLQYLIENSKFTDDKEAFLIKEFSYYDIKELEKIKNCYFLNSICCKFSKVNFISIINKVIVQKTTTGGGLSIQSDVLSIKTPDDKYYDKYIKYKLKYLTLSNKIGFI